jgi:DNA-binding response OmpR family regulator
MMTTLAVAKVCMREGPVSGLGPARFARMARDEGWWLVEEGDLVALMLNGPQSLDLLVLETGAPADGIAPVRAARERFPTAGIVLCGQVGTPLQVAAALDAGADEVVGDWIRGDELVARIRRLVVLRHQAPRERAAAPGI